MLKKKFIKLPKIKVWATVVYSNDDVIIMNHKAFEKATKNAFFKLYFLMIFYSLYSYFFYSFAVLFS